MARDIDDDAPWLAEGVPDNRRDNRSSTMVPRGRLFGGILVFVLLLALIAVGLYVVVAGKKSSGSSAGVTRAEDAPLIAADTGPYKIAPANPGGLTVEGADQTIYAAGTGVETDSTIDPSRAAEEPLDRPGTASPSGSVPALAVGNVAPAGMPPKDLLPQVAIASVPVKATEPAAKPSADQLAPKPKPISKPQANPVMHADPKPVAMPVPVPVALKSKPAPLGVAAADKPASGSVSLQLGAFSSADKAEAAWTRVVAKHGELGGFDHRIEPLDRAGTTLYRLRVRHVGDHEAATALCAKLAAMGDACLVAS